MKAKYPGTCKKTGRRFEKGDEIKWLGKGKGAVLISYADRNEYVPAHKKTWDGNPFNEAGEPMMTGEQYRAEINAMEMEEYYRGYDY